MRTPIQAKPVMRNVSTAKINAGIEPSNCWACNLLPGNMKAGCRKDWGCD